MSASLPEELDQWISMERESLMRCAAHFLSSCLPESLDQWISMEKESLMRCAAHFLSSCWPQAYGQMQVSGLCCWGYGDWEG